MTPRLWRGKHAPVPNLTEILTSDAKKSLVIADCCTLIDQEVADKGGLSGLAIKAAYAAVKGIKPGFITHAVTDLLPEFAAALDPIYSEAVAQQQPVASYFERNAGRVADALLAITDRKAQRANSGVARSGYEKLRPSAKKNVEQAVPRMGKMVAKHTT